MHVVVSLLFAIAGLCWALQALYNSGFLDFINPFKARRRIGWRKKTAQSPLYCIDNPMEVAAVLIIGVAKMEGDITREHKEFILGLFEKTFCLSNRDAVELFKATEFLLREQHDLSSCLSKVIRPSRANFDYDRTASLIELMRQSAGFEDDITRNQQDLCSSVRTLLR